jgi:predicted nucleic-acid-binding protein
MRAVDTNVLVRLLTGDDVAQLAKAEAFVASGAWVSHVVLCETVWVLEAVYERSRTQLISAVEMLLAHATLVLESRTCVEQALQDMASASKVDFSDALILAIARHAGHVPLGTFDRHLATLSDAERL